MSTNPVRMEMNMFLSPLSVFLWSLEWWSHLVTGSEQWRRQLEHNALLATDARRRLTRALTVAP